MRGRLRGEIEKEKFAATVDVMTLPRACFLMVVLNKITPKEPLRETFSTKPTKNTSTRSPNTSKRSLNQSVLSPWLLCNREAFSTKPTKNTSTRSPKTSKRSLNQSVLSPWLLCNREAFSTKPTKKHAQKKPKPEHVEIADSPAVRDHQTTPKRSLNHCVLKPSPFSSCSSF